MGHMNFTDNRALNIQVGSGEYGTNGGIRCADSAITRAL